jgi:hypothetical protein
MHFNAQRSTPINREQALNAERSIQNVGRLLAIYRSWALDVERRAFRLQ